MKTSPPAPHFVPADFTPAPYFSTAADKAAFANRLVRLINGDFKPSLFTEVLYSDLHLCFGFIAHYDREGFYASQLSTLPQRIQFLQYIHAGGIFHQVVRAAGANDPHSSRGDVEAAFRHHPWLKSHLDRLASELARLTEAGERADLRRLAQKYPNELDSLI